jgi:hypothetical protein
VSYTNRFKTYNCAVCDPRLTPLDTRVFWRIIDRLNRKGYCWPSQELIAKEIGSTRRSVNRSIKKLALYGYLNVEGGRGRNKPCTYWLLNVSKATHFNDEQAVNETNGTPKMSHLVPENVSKEIQEPLKEPPKEPLMERARVLRHKAHASPFPMEEIHEKAKKITEIACLIETPSFINREQEIIWLSVPTRWMAGKANEISDVFVKILRDYDQSVDTVSFIISQK